jgi:hypothetical protein
MLGGDPASPDAALQHDKEKEMWDLFLDQGFTIDESVASFVAKLPVEAAAQHKGIDSLNVRLAIDDELFGDVGLDDLAQEDLLRRQVDSLDKLAQNVDGAFLNQGRLINRPIKRCEDPGLVGIFT